MKIGLVNVDGHVGKKKWGSTAYPNLALGKIARYWKDKGAEVEWALPMTHYDKVYMAKVFNFTPDAEYIYDADEIIKGGTGYDLHSTLPDYIDRLQPLYDIFDVPKDTAYGFLTRGCPNKCSWCVVPKKEGAIKPYMDIDEIAIEGRRKIVLMDNNILAAGDYAITQLEKIQDKGYTIDFNQAMDARLVTDDIAKLLASIKWMYSNRIRFGCDTHAQIEDCKRAIEMIKSHGFKGQFFLYTMIGGHNDFHECYDRIMYWWKELQNARARIGGGNYVYCHAQPYRDPMNPKHIIPQWQKDLAQWTNKKQLFTKIPFERFIPRKDFCCQWYMDKMY